MTHVHPDTFHPQDLSAMFAIEGHGRVTGARLTKAGARSLTAQESVATPLAGQGGDESPVTVHEATASDGLHDDRLQGVPDTLADKTGKGGEAGGSLPVAPVTILAMTRAEKIKLLRPHCQRPAACNSSGGKSHCWPCRQAAGLQDGAA